MGADGGKQEALTDEQRYWIELAVQVVPKLARRLAPALRMDETDLLSAGNEALVDAARRYDPEGGRSFKSWAWLRVRGAMINASYANEPARKRLHNATAILERSQSILEETHQREPALRRRVLEDRVAANRRAVEMAAAMVTASRIAAEEATDESLRPDDAVESGQRRDRLHTALEQLEENDRQLFQRVYFDGISLRAYATELERNVSSVSRRHTRLLSRLAELMEHRPASPPTRASR